MIENDINSIHAISLPQYIPHDSIALHLGYPDPDTFQIDDIKKLINQKSILDRSSLQYCEEEGDQILRNCIVKSLYQNNKNINDSNIIITQGTTDAIEVIVKLFLNEGDIVILEAPSYLWAIRVFKMAKCELKTCILDSEGIRTDLVYDFLKKYNKSNNVKFLYLIPDFQNPSGITLSYQRRKELVDIAANFNVPIIEDCAYLDLRYEGDTLPTLLDLDNKGIVIQARTFSKTIGPGIRLGWLAGQRDLITKLIRMKQTGSCTFTSRIVAGYLNSHLYEHNIKKTIQIYKRKYELLRNILTETFLGSMRPINWPGGGFYLWLEFDKRINISLLHNIAAKNNLLFLKGCDFYPNFLPDNAIRLSFSYEKLDRLASGMEILRNIIKQL